MSTTRKDLYVGTDKHKWWKEAVVYQVRPNTTLDICHFFF